MTYNDIYIDNLMCSLLKLLLSSIEHLQVPAVVPSSFTGVFDSGPRKRTA